MITLTIRNVHPGTRVAVFKGEGVDAVMYFMQQNPPDSPTPKHWAVSVPPGTYHVRARNASSGEWYDYPYPALFDYDTLIDVGMVRMADPAPDEPEPPKVVRRFNPLRAFGPGGFSILRAFGLRVGD